VGIHKDDLVFEIEGYPIKKFGSQGQRKSLLIALKLAQFDMLKQITTLTPLLAERKEKLKQFNYRFNQNTRVENLEREPAYKRQEVELSDPENGGSSD
jgi:hypothetical protein